MTISESRRKEHPKELVQDSSSTDELVELLKQRYKRMILKIYDDVDLSKDNRKKLIELNELYEQTIFALKEHKYVQAYEITNTINQIAVTLGYNQAYLDNSRENLKFVYPGFIPTKSIAVDQQVVFLQRAQNNDSTKNFEDY